MIGSSLDTTEQQFLDADTIYVAVYSENDDTPIFSQTINIAAGSYVNGKFTYRSSGSNITSLQLDLYNDSFYFVARRIDLNELGNEATLEIKVGDYLGQGLSSYIEKW